MMKQSLRFSQNNTIAIRQQGGAALIVSLIILAGITIFGVAAMQSSNLQLKMASSAKVRNIAFSAAETALNIAEKQLLANPPTFDQLNSSCTGDGCFTAACTDGLCFSGEYDYTDFKKVDCENVVDGDTTAALPLWELDGDAAAFWSNAAKYRTITVDQLDDPVKYIIEFLCYVDSGAGDGTVVFDRDNDTLGLPLFQITALAEGPNGRSKVMLQSTFMVTL